MLYARIRYHGNQSQSSLVLRCRGGRGLLLLLSWDAHPHGTQRLLQRPSFRTCSTSGRRSGLVRQELVLHLLVVLLKGLLEGARVDERVGRRLQLGVARRRGLPDAALRAVRVLVGVDLVRGRRWV